MTGKWKYFLPDKRIFVDMVLVKSWNLSNHKIMKWFHCRNDMIRDYPLVEIDDSDSIQNNSRFNSQFVWIAIPNAIALYLNTAACSPYISFRNLGGF